MKLSLPKPILPLAAGERPASEFPAFSIKPRRPLFFPIAAFKNNIRKGNPYKRCGTRMTARGGKEEDAALRRTEPPDFCRHGGRRLFLFLPDRKAGRNIRHVLQLPPQAAAAAKRLAPNGMISEFLRKH